MNWSDFPEAFAMMQHFSGSPLGALRRALAALPSFTLGVAFLGCGPRDAEAPATDTIRGRSAAATTSRVAVVEGFSTPEAVRYDPNADVFYVANINGNPAAKDNNGFISRVRADGAIDSLRFIVGGRDGVTLHAPKGMAIVGDTLWVADVDALRGFNRQTGAPVASIELIGRAKFLNDVAATSEGVIYVTDTGIQFDAAGQVSHPGPDRVLRVTGRRASVVIEAERLSGPNGIAWDAANQRLLVAPVAGSTVLSWRASDQEPTTVASGTGQFDGIEVLGDGRILVSSWADSTVYVLARGDSTMKPLIRNVPAPADIGIDTRRNRVAVPLLMSNRVELWEIH